MPITQSSTFFKEKDIVIDLINSIHKRDDGKEGNVEVRRRGGCDGEGWRE